MRGRFTLASPIEDIMEYFNIDDFIEIHQMENYPVSSLVNKPANDTKECIEPLESTP